MNLPEQFGSLDIYIFDQLLRGNIAPGMTILDAGCGSGRNLVYFLQERYNLLAADQSAEAIGSARSLVRRLAPQLPAANIRHEPIERMSFPEACAEVVLCNSVLHFARDEAHFEAMLSALWRCVRPGGILFCRLASTIGMEFERIEGRRHRLPGGTEWYLVDEAYLLHLTERLNADLVDPLKSTVVQRSRSMTTWVLRKLSTQTPPACIS